NSSRTSGRTLAGSRQPASMLPRPDPPGNGTACPPRTALTARQISDTSASSTSHNTALTDRTSVDAMRAAFSASSRRWPMRPGSVFAVGTLVIGLLAATPTSALADPPAAPGGPGALSHFDLARKDSLGTARNTTSKIWYTIAGGVLSDVYAPTIDTTNVETMQYVVTDGSTFTDLQTRDMTYAVAADTTGMVCTVTATAK